MKIKNKNTGTIFEMHPNQAQELLLNYPVFFEVFEISGNEKVFFKENKSQYRTIREKVLRKNI